MTLSEWIKDYCEDNDITLPDGIPTNKVALALLTLDKVVNLYEEIGDLADSLEPVAITDIQHHQNVAVDYNNSYKIGKLVIINIRITLNYSTPAGTGLITGLPKCGDKSASSLVAVAVNKSDLHCSLTGNGLIVAVGSATPTGSNYILSCAYIEAGE